MKSSNKPKIKKADVKSEAKLRKTKKVETEDIVLEDTLDEEDSVEPTTEELDPEILAALNAKKKKQANKQIHDIDYIPELERGDTDFDIPSDDKF